MGSRLPNLFCGFFPRDVSFQVIVGDDLLTGAAAGAGRTADAAAGDAGAPAAEGVAGDGVGAPGAAGPLGAADEATASAGAGFARPAGGEGVGPLPAHGARGGVLPSALIPRLLCLSLSLRVRPCLLPLFCLRVRLCLLSRL